MKSEIQLGKMLHVTANAGLLHVVEHCCHVVNLGLRGVQGHKGGNGRFYGMSELKNLRFFTRNK